MGQGIIIIISLLIAGIFTVVTFVYALFAWFYSSRLIKFIHRPIDQNEPTSYCSIIIPCRNETQVIERCLKSIAQQSFSQYEVILVDDHSNDQLLDYLNTLHIQIPFKYIINEGSGKKSALETGIKNAQYNNIFTTDADCILGTNNLKQMMQMLGDDNHMVCGLLSYQNTNNLFGQLQQAESAAIVGISSYMLNTGRPATCNGANLLFRKDIFYKVDGYSLGKEISSGDDDLLMHKFVELNPARVIYSASAETTVYTKAEHKLKNFFNQRMRWAGKRKHYIFPYNQYLIWLLGLKLIVFWTTFGFSIYSGNFNFLLISGFIVFSDVLIAYRTKDILNFKYYLIPILPFYQLYVPIVFIANFFIKPSWKGRKVVQ